MSKMESLPSAFFLTCDQSTLIDLWRTSKTLHLRLNDNELLINLFNILIVGVHTDTEDYLKIQETGKILSDRKGSFSLIITTIGKYYLSPLSYRFLDLDTYIIRAAGYGQVELFEALAVGNYSYESPSLEAIKYGHLNIITVIMSQCLI